MKPWLILPAALLTSIASANSFYCPNTTNYIEIGYTPQQVKAACGAPKNEVKQKQRDQKTVEATQWMYRFRNVSDPTRSRPNLMVVFVDSKVVTIRLDGQPVNATQICGQSIKLGFSEADIRNACGPAGFVNQTEETINQGIKDVIIWKYQFDQFAPETTLIFEKGKLKLIQ